MKRTLSMCLIVLSLWASVPAQADAYSDVRNAYLVYLNREPDMGGWTAYAAAYAQSRMSLGQVINALCTSAEASQLVINTYRLILMRDPESPAAVWGWQTRICQAGYWQARREIAYSGEGLGKINEAFVTFLQRFPANDGERNFWAETNLNNGLGGVRLALSTIPRNEIIGFYQGYLGRTPGSNEVDFWINANAGMGLAAVRREISHSNEAIQRIGDGFSAYLLRGISSPDEGVAWMNYLEANGLGNVYAALSRIPRNEIISFYQRFLDRTPSSGEVDFWIGRNGQVGLAQVRHEIAFSAEGQAKIGQAYLTFLGRNVESQAATNAWAGYNESTNMSAVRAGLARSDEGRGLIVTAYRRFLMREPEAGAVDFWVNRNLQVGLDRVFYEISHSDEAKAKIATGYARILGRAANSSETGAWADINRNQGLSAVLLALGKSAEGRAAIDNVYVAQLGRHATEGELASAAVALVGSSLSTLASQLYAAKEAQTYRQKLQCETEVKAAYPFVLAQSPSAQATEQTMASCMSGKSVGELLAASGDGQAMIAKAYGLVLDRTPTGDETSGAVKPLSRLGITAFTLELAKGTEGDSQLRGLFHDVLQREPTSGEMNKYVPMLAQTGMGMRGVKKLLEDTDEGRRVEGSAVLSALRRLDQSSGGDACDERAAFPATCGRMDEECFTRAPAQQPNCG